MYNVCDFLTSRRKVTLDGLASYSNQWSNELIYTEAIVEFLELLFAIYVILFVVISLSFA